MIFFHGLEAFVGLAVGFSTGMSSPREIFFQAVFFSDLFSAFLSDSDEVLDRAGIVGLVATVDALV